MAIETGAVCGFSYEFPVSFIGSLLLRAWLEDLKSWGVHYVHFHRRTPHFTQCGAAQTRYKSRSYHAFCFSIHIVH